LSNNNITEIPKEIQQLKKLKRLNLWQNSIEKLPLTIKYLTSLSDVGLGHNPISDTEKEVIKELIPFSDISFDNEKYVGIEDAREYFNLCNGIDSIRNQFLKDQNNKELKIRFVRTLNYLANLHINFKQFIKAEETIREGLKYDPSNIYFNVNLPLTLLIQKKYQEATQLYKFWKNKPFVEGDQKDVFKNIF
jgi:Leucine-rich repeat (LRR) protein